MSEFKSMPLHKIPLRVLLIFRRMYKQEIKPGFLAQVLHGVYLAYLLSIYIAWALVAWLSRDGFFSLDYYGVICLYFLGISIASIKLNTELRKLLGLFNPLEDFDFEFLSTDSSVSDLIESSEIDVARIYRPSIVSTSYELAETFMDISDASVHKLFILRYTNAENNLKVFHIVDSTMTRKLFVVFNEEDSTIDVY